METKLLGDGPYENEFLGDFSRFGMHPVEFHILTGYQGFCGWYSYKLRELECIREHHKDPKRLLFELTLLEREHPSPMRRGDAVQRLKQFAQGELDEIDDHDHYDAQDDPTVPDAAKI